MTDHRGAVAKVFEKIPAGMIPGIVGGLVAGYTRLHPAWAPAQIPALALLAWALARATGVVGRLRPGLWFGMAMAALVLGNIGIPMQAAAILFAALSGYWMLLGAGLSHLLQRGDLRGVFGAAGLLTLGEWAQCEALPMFGTAQRIASAWVEYDAALPVSRVAGTLGVTFVVGLIAFVSAKSFPPKENRGSTYRVIFTPRPLIPVMAITLILGALGSLLGKREREASPHRLTVAVCGVESGAFLDETDFLEKYRPMLERAAAKGAKLVVTPEMGLFVKDAERDATLARLAEEARRLGVPWVVGYAQSGPSLNRAVILNANETEAHGQDARATTASRPIGTHYDKTHWVPYMETYARYGDGGAVTGEVSGAKVGLMICQDDNYETVASNLSRAGAQIAAVPTFDWSGVEFAHLNSARNRPREFGFVEARAAIGGVSAVIAPTGEILASRNHLVEGDGVVVATVDVPVGGPTTFARFGNLPLLALAAALVANALWKNKSGAEAHRSSVQN